MSDQSIPQEIIMPGDTGAALTTVTPVEELIRLATDGVNSPRSKRNYEIALREFFIWHRDQGAPLITKALVNRYKAHLQDKHLAPATINLKLSAIRKLVKEAADNGFIDQAQANGVKAVAGVPIEGVRMGNWLTFDQAQALINKPDIATKKGLRDRAVLAVLIGAGLRREECAALTVEHLQQRAGRWVIVDLIGKRGKVRSVPIAAWVKNAVDDWLAAAGITTGVIWRSFRKGDHLDKKSGGMTSQAIWGIVSEYAGALGFENLAPHDLRRTFAKLARQLGSALEQVSLNLGHSSLDVTKKYLGTDLDLQNAPSDMITIKLNGRPQRLPGIEGD